MDRSSPKFTRSFARKESSCGKIVQQYSVPGIGDLSATERKIINGVYVSYSPLDPFRLSHITHGEGTPWAKYNKRYYATIPNEEIAEYYQTIVRENRGNV